jgi:Cu(I)/Ag(I) efflux system membrane fusion protein
MTRRIIPWAVALAGLVAGAALVSLLPAGKLFHQAGEHDPSAATGERWACPMMDFIGARPGTCPVCGMKLQLVTAGEINAEQASRLGLQTSRAVEGPAVATVRAYGVVRYDDRSATPVIPRVGGRIVKRHSGALHAGELVEAGEPLVDLYSPEVFSAQGELASAVQLGGDGLKRSLVERFARWNLSPVADAILAGGKPVDTVTITSPFAGRVLSGGMAGGMDGLPEVGQEIMAGQPILRLVDPNAFILVIQIPESRAHWIRAGQPVELSSDDRGELPGLDARVSWVSPELTLDLRSREVHVHLRGAADWLLPGSLVSARMKVALDAALGAADPADPATQGRFVLVPKTAVLSTGVRHVAWKIVERKPDGRVRVEIAPLALGPRLEDESGNDLYVVRAGLKAGDEVATQGLFLVDSQSQLAGTPSLLFPSGASAAPETHSH